MPLVFKIGNVFSDAQGVEYTVIDVEAILWTNQNVRATVTFRYFTNQTMTVSFPATSTEFESWRMIRKPA